MPESSLKVLTKLKACRAAIKASDLRKAGRNKYSEYNYYTPEQVNELVYGACLTEGLFNKFSLIRDTNGLHGWLKVIDIESGESESFQMSTEMPVITATNASQQMGGCATFTNRYLLMNAYDIVENSLDPDSQDNRPQKTPSKRTVVLDPEELPWLNEGTPEYEVVKAAIVSGKRTIADARKKYKINRKIAALLEQKEI
ncbi:MAG TPA: ERF family protein [Alphaproteobacteria bacterium]|nr:ERF family protein [Alphaproteobacteria bacterium]